MDLGTGLALFGAAKLAEKILGPTAEYIGDGIKTWTKNRVDNVNEIFRKAGRKLGPRIDDEGQVNPKVLRGILDEGSFCEDDLGREYFAGVLASARTNVARDDRGAAIIALLARLSNYQVRTHYVVYSFARQLYAGSGLDFSIKNRDKMNVYMSDSVYCSAMDFDESEQVRDRSIREHVFFGLAREGLIGPFNYGDTEYIESLYSGGFDEPGIVVAPSVLGVRLYLAAHGRQELGTSELLSSQLEFDMGSVSSTIGAARDVEWKSSRILMKDREGMGGGKLGYG